MFKVFKNLVRPERLAVQVLGSLVPLPSNDIDNTFLKTLKKEGVSTRGLVIAGLTTLASKTDSQVDDALLKGVLPVIRKVL